MEVTWVKVGKADVVVHLQDAFQQGACAVLVLL